MKDYTKDPEWLKDSVVEELNIPQNTLDIIDAQAKELGVSRDYIVNEALKEFMPETISVEEFQKRLNEDEEKTLKKWYILTENSVKKVHCIPFDLYEMMFGKVSDEVKESIKNFKE
jgi:hypothetical protein